MRTLLLGLTACKGIVCMAIAVSTTGALLDCALAVVPMAVLVAEFIVPRFPETDDEAYLKRALIERRSPTTRERF